jgi:hypothetical protein
MLSLRTSRALRAIIEFALHTPVLGRSLLGVSLVNDLFDSVLACGRLRPGITLALTLSHQLLERALLSLHRLLQPCDEYLVITHSGDADTGFRALCKHASVLLQIPLQLIAALLRFCQTALCRRHTQRTLAFKFIHQLTDWLQSLSSFHLVAPAGGSAIVDVSDEMLVARSTRSCMS